MLPPKYMSEEGYLKLGRFLNGTAQSYGRRRNDTTGEGEMVIPPSGGVDHPTVGGSTSAEGVGT